MRIALFLGVVFIASVVRAAPPDPTAQALFRKGRDLVAKGDWDAGCEQLRASNERFEAASTTLNLARCAEHFGKIASAWALYHRGRTLAREEPAQRRAELERVADAGVQAMEPRLPRLRIEVNETAESVHIAEAGISLPIREDVPLDPGNHDIVIEAAGYESQTRRVVLEEGKTSALSVTLVKIATEPPPELPAAPPPPVARERPRQEQPIRPAVETDTSIPTWVWISSVAGVVLTGASIGFALDAAAQSRKLENECGSDFVCNENPSFDPGPTNARKNRDIGLAIGLGSAGLVGIGAAIYGFGNVRARASATTTGFWISTGGTL